MKIIGIFQAKTHFSDICEKVSRTGEPILITKRGVPIVRIDPISPDKRISNVWSARKNFIKKHGAIDEDIEIPNRSIDKFRDPLEK